MFEGLVLSRCERLTQRFARVTPWIVAALAIMAIGATMKRKGVVRGGVDTALNAIPIVGPVKNAVEAVCGRDLIADRPAARPATSRR